MTSRLTDLWPGKGLGPALLTTFTFDGPFFEAVLLGHLVDREAHPIVLFVDRAKGYADALHCLPALHACGRDYRLVAFDAMPGVFHPKVQLFHRAGVALVGSGNLTRGGTGLNLEAFDRIARETEPRAFAEVVAFFRALVRDRRTALDEGSRDELLRAIVEPETSPGGDECVFLHSLESGLTDQLAGGLLPDPRPEVMLAAPFHDADHGASRKLAEVLSGGTRHVRIAADRDAQPPRAPDGWVSGDLDDGRRLHAKIAYATGPDLSALVVGSANLTRPAWSGTNVEAVVVRQALSAGAYDAFVNAKTFVPHPWKGAAGPPRVEPKPSLPVIPLAWAALDGRRLTVVLQSPPPEEPRFFLVERDRTTGVELGHAGQGEWTGVLAEEPAGVAAVRVEAKGFAPAIAFVSQEATLRIQPRLARIRQAISRVGKVPLAPEERSGLLAHIADLVVAVGAAVPIPAGAPPGASKQAARPEAPSLPLQDDPIRFVDDALVQPPQGVLIPAGGLRRLKQIIDAALRFTTGVPAIEGTHRRWRPPADGGGGDGGGDGAGDVDGEGGSEPDGNDEGPIDDALAVADVAAGVLPQLLERSRERAITVYEVGLRALVNAADVSPSRARVIASRAIAWIAGAWANAAWPDRANGWALEATPRPDPVESEQAVLRMIEHVLLDEGDAELELDRARLILVGISRDHAPAPLKPELAEMRERLSRRRNLSERAEAIIAPLLALDEAAVIRTRARAELKAIEESVREHQARVAGFGKRSETHKASSAELGRLAPALDELRPRVEAAEAAFAESERRVRDAPPRVGPRDQSLLELWKGARPNKAGRRVHVPEGDVCGACHTRLPATKAQLLGDPRAVVTCPCGVLVVRGPRRRT